MGTEGEWKDSAAEKTPDAPMKEDDIFGVDLRLAKPESRSIVGSYAQRTIPIRSASFSQVDFSSADGKYIRSASKPTSPFSCFPSSTASGNVFPLSSTSVIASGSLTLPRKKLSDVPISSPPITTCTEEPVGSTPSVDSAVGSEEGYISSSASKIPVVNKEGSDVTHKVPGSRSLTYPLPKRGTRSDDDIPFSSIDGNGLKSLQYVSSGRELQQVQEESEASLADCQLSSSMPEELAKKPDGSSENDIFHDWRKAEECHLTCEPPVCLGEVVVCTVDQEEPAPSYHITDDKAFIPDSTSEQSYCFLADHSTPEDDMQLVESSADNASQPKDISESTEYIIKHLNDVSNSSDANKAEEVENHALEEALNHSQEDKSTIEECQNVISEVPLPEDSNKQNDKVFITEWPGEDANESKVYFETNNPCENTDSGSDCHQIEDKNVTQEVDKSHFSDFSQEGIEESSPAQTINISAQWHRTDDWDSAQEESQSPEDSGKTRVRWPKSERENRRWLEKPKLVYQSSEEREDDNTNISTPRRFHTPVRSDSLSEGESDQGERSHIPRECTASPSPFAPSDLSDSEGRSGIGTLGESRSPHTPRRYYKRPLRGPYGQMLEAEMSKAETNRIPKLQLEFLDKYVSSQSSPSRTSPASADTVMPNITARPRALTTQSLDDSQLKGGYGRSSPAPAPSRASPKRKVSANIPYSPGSETSGQNSQPQQQFVCHQRTTSSPSQLEGFSGPSPRPELLAELLRGSTSERVYNENSPQHGKVSQEHIPLLLLLFSVFFKR